MDEGSPFLITNAVVTDDLMGHFITIHDRRTVSCFSRSFHLLHETPLGEIIFEIYCFRKVLSTGDVQIHN